MLLEQKQRRKPAIIVEASLSFQEGKDESKEGKDKDVTTRNPE
jgi:hypothetical protein